VPAATTAAVAALFATLLTLDRAFDDGRTADLARANFVLALAAIFLIFDLAGARFEDVLDLPRLVAFFISSSSGMCESKTVYPILPGFWRGFISTFPYLLCGGWLYVF
jgi:hypothetical protein